jgi:ABC-type lipoprotein release transport system permease subunit
MNSFLPMLLRISFRNIQRNGRRSLYTILAISFGLFCLIVFQALKNGLHREMAAGTISLDTGSIQIHAHGYEPNLATLRPVPEPERVEQAVGHAGISTFARRIRTPALLISGTASSSVILYGVEPEREPAVTTIASRLTAGRYPAAGSGALVGEELARSLGLGVGGRITLMAQGTLGQPTFRSFPIAGTFHTELPSFDRSRIYLPLPDLQQFLGAGGGVTEFVLLTPFGAEQGAAERLSRLLPPERYQVRSWQAIVPDLTQLIELNDATMRLLILIVFFIVALGITNTMSMAIYERIRELGVLAAIGTTPARIMGMVVVESCYLGLLASAIGSTAGVLACIWLARHGIDLSRFTSNNQYFAMGHVLKAHLTLFDLATANLTTLATALLAGLYPAWKGGRLDPVAAMRHT